MEVRCHHCGSLVTIAGDIFGKREKADVTCPACARTFRVANPKLATFRSETTETKVSPVDSQVAEDGRLLRLPDHEEIVLRVVEGEESGTVYPVVKPRVTIGRGNTDIVISDPTVSRIHCALEVGEDGVVLRDLGSTNGTIVNGRPVRTALLSPGSKFRVGYHVFQVSVMPKVI